MIDSAASGLATARVAADGDRDPGAAPSCGFDDDILAGLRAGLGTAGTAVGLCDAADRLRYANDMFRTAFCPDFDGRPRDFVDTVGAAIRDGTGIRLTTTDLDAFCARIRARRRALAGTFSFTTDTTDGRWWWMTDSRLPNGWMMIVGQDISSLKHDEFRLRDAHASALAEARTDELTGAPNRRHGLCLAEAAVAAAHREELGLAVALMDIDHFKTINDRHGHEAGDAALRHFASQLGLGMGPDDQFCRLGGDEFLMLSRGSDMAQLERRLGELFANLPTLLIPGLRDGLRLSISTGIATFEPGDDWPSLFRRADRALYTAKATGRDRIARAA